MDRMTENVLEFIEGQKIATVTFSQKRYVFKVKKLAKAYPELCQIVAQNDDGSIIAHLPVNWIRVNPVKVDEEAIRKEYLERFSASYRRGTGECKYCF